MSKNVQEKFNKVIKIDEEKIHQHLGELVRGTVEETLNKLLDAEADYLCNAARYEQTQARKDTRAWHYKRSLHAKAGEVSFKVPKLHEHKFETAIIERYRRRIRTNNPVERILREGRRRRRVVGAFPDGNSALMLVAARLRLIAGTR